MQEDNPPITCPLCGSTDQEYIYAGEWICGDCDERWNERSLPNPAGGNSQREQGDDQQGGAKSGDGSRKPL